MKYLMAISIVFSFLLGFLAIHVSQKDFETELEKRLGTEILDILSNPDSVRLGVTFSTGFSYGGTGKEYLLKNTLYKLNASQAFNIQKLILDSNHYIFDKAKKGLFVPTTALYFEKNHQSVAVLISSLLNQVKIVKDEKTIILDYDPMEKEFNSQISTLGDL